jgi:phage-related protein
MAENTSVGGVTISLDLEASGDIKGQIEKMSANIGKQIEASLKNIGNIDFKSMADTISNTISKAIDNSMKNLQQNIQKTINSALSNIKGVKIPVDFANPTNAPAQKESAVSGLSALRAPPIPKIKTGVNFEAIKAQIDNLTGSIDITNAKIEQQQEKLAQLKESYNMAFNDARKNKLQEEILKTETTINKLIATSDKAGFKLADLDAQFAVLSNITKGAAAGIGVVNENLKKTANNGSNASGSMKHMSGSMKDMHHNMYSLSGIMRQFFTWMVVLPIVMKGITAISTGLRNMLMTNSQFANSLNQIKSNLMTAFMPIYQAVLPAINTLMSALVTVTGYIASFLSQIFGKTYQQSFNAAKAMQTQVGALTQTEKQAKKTATSLTGVGKAATAAGNAAKSASQGLASFDQINTLGGNKSAGGAGAPGSGVITPITPMANMAPIESITSKWFNGFKKALDTIFQPFKNAWAKDGAGVTAEFNRAIEGTKATISNFFKALATPPIQKFMESIGLLGLTIGKLFLFVYNNYVLPLGNWIIAHAPGIASALTPIVDTVTNFLNWLMGDGKPILDVIVIVLGSMAVAFGVVTTAVKIFNAVTSVIALITSPIGIAVLVIGTLIAIGILLYKNWGTISAFLIGIWNGIKTTASIVWNAIVTTIKNVFNGIGTWFSNIFTGAWNGIKSAFSAVGSFFGGVWNTIKNMFTSIGSTIGNAIGGAFKYTVNSIISFAENTINGFIRAINGAIRLINLIPGVNIRTLNTLSIPKLARGGVIDQPTLAMVGERGKEAVMPLENNTGWIDTLASKLNSKGQSSDEIAKLLQIIIEILNNLGMDINLDGDKFAKATIKNLNRRTRQVGKTELII